MALNDYARSNNPFTRVGRQQVAVDVSSVIRASPDSFRVAWVERRYENGQLAETTRWANAVDTMRVVVQRGASARVEVDGLVTAVIGPGLLVLVGFEANDADGDLAWMSAKLARLSIFPDPAGLMNRSLIETQGEALVVSQFTLFASTKKGNRPSWSRAARPVLAQPLFERFVACLGTAIGRGVQPGVFGADMRIHLVNDGPVTISLDSQCPE